MEEKQMLILQYLVLNPEETSQVKSLITILKDLGAATCKLVNFVDHEV